MSTQHAPTILVIDNDEGLVLAITTRLEDAGFSCVTAGTGAQGLAIFRGRPIDLVITDLNMPAGDGVALAQSMRQTSDVPIIVVTGFHDAYRKELRSIRNVTLVEKPFESTQLLELVEAELVLAGCELPEARS